MTCIYCGQEKAESAFNTEHVIPKSLGTFDEKNITLQTVCSDCNQYLGDKLDLLIGRSSMEALLRFIHGVKSLSLIGELRYTNLVVTYNGDEPWKGAKLKVIVENDELVVDLLSQAALNLQETGRTFFLLDELKELGGNLKPHLSPRGRVFLIHRDDADKNLLLRELERLGVSFTPSGEAPPLDIESIEGSNLSISYQQVDLIRRGLCKIAFEYFASQMGSDLALRSDFDAIRSYILSGKKPNHRFFLGAHPDVDMRKGKTTQTGRYHVLLIDWGLDLRSIVSQIELFGTTHYRIVLAEKYGGLFRADLPRGHFSDLETRRVYEMRKGRIIIP